MGRYVQLGYEERLRIEIWRGQGETIRGIADRLGRAPSTVSRELRRLRREYSSFSSQGHARECRRRRRHWPKLCDPRLRSYIEDGLRTRWSPQQIAWRMSRDYPDDLQMRISHETIYAWLYVVPRGGLRRELLAALRQPRAKRRQQRASPDARGQITGAVSIHQRPPEIEGRQIPGHWEGDLIKGAGNRSSVGVLVERHSRYVHLARMRDATADSAYDGFTRSLNTVPTSLRKTLTYDRGKEMSRHADLSLDLQISVYFADPHSPWQRGTCENTNGLLRQYMPKGTDLSHLTQDDLDAIAFELNGRPRKTLDWRTPREVFVDCLQSPNVALET